MKSITIYTGPLCNYCDAAKRLFDRNNNLNIYKQPVYKNDAWKKYFNFILIFFKKLPELTGSPRLFIHHKRYGHQK